MHKCPVVESGPERIVGGEKQTVRKPRTTDNRDKKEIEFERLDKASEIGLTDSFPASDAVAAVQPLARN